ncbi:MAG: LysM peptidoglycan-binding domain-containing protein [Gammaproteobacteria bacterium]|nr:LysM peptidoglycan-binding domain-containing protein [Gammaproteobacteria bacterium]
MRGKNQTVCGLFATPITLLLLIGSLASPQPTALATTPEFTILGGAGDLVSRLEKGDAAAVPATAAAEPDDLLLRLRQRFALDAVDNDRVDAEIRWFVRNPDYLQRVFLRSQRYLPHIVAEIEARGMPLELALLPIVESAYDPFAYSHGRAAGLWQIVPGTGRRFGIRQNWWYDGRRDVVDSTRGALEYLAYLHELMDSDWLLAVASYNSGEGNVLKAIRRNREKSRPTDFWNLSLSRETSSYVPRLLALVELVQRPQDYGLTLPVLSSAQQFSIVQTGGQLDLALAAELAGIELDTLYAFNPGFNRWATDPSGPHVLVLPADSVESFAAALSDLAAEQRMRWQRHRIKNGETISEIAEQYHTTIASIRNANDLRGTTIRAGSWLMIPMAAKPLSDYGQSADQRRQRTQNRQRQGKRVDHVVAAGESFWSIGQRYGVTTRVLAGWNGMAPRDTLSIGQKLVVWTSDTDVPASRAASGGTTRKLHYTVRRGDSLFLIASRFRVSVADLLRWNNIEKDKILRPGQRLTMYVDVTSQSS